MLKENIFWKTLSLVLILIVIYFYNKPVENKIQYIKIPSKEGSFSDIKLDNIDLPNYIFISNKDTIELENPVNKELEHQYLKAKQNNDSLKLELLYLQSIQIRKYQKNFKDKNIDINVEANVTGFLDTLNISYKIHEDSIKLKKDFLRFLVGPKLDLLDNKLYPGLSLGIQNKNNNVFIGSINTNKDFSFSYIHNIFTIKK